MYGKDILFVEVSLSRFSDTSIVLFDRHIVEQSSPEVSLGTPSILFSSYNAKEMRDQLIKNGVTVSEIMEIQNTVTFNFSDIEGNYFAIGEISKN